jgi:salicylate biosynthesis isochorismate synthase/menaquinone-specific isochorismate synthase
MMAVTIASSGGVLSAELRDRARLRIDAALARARAKGRPVLAAVTSPLDGLADPAAIVVASRRAGESWFCFEQPERAASALATLGSVLDLEASGPGRFEDVGARWRELAAEAVTDERSATVAVGGFAFAPDGGRSPRWSGFPPARLTVPEVAIARQGTEVRLTLAVLVAPDDDGDAVFDRIARRVAELRDEPLPLLDPDPAGRSRIVATMPPEHYEAAVARAVQHIRAGELQKVIVARTVEVHAPRPHDAAAVFGVLRDGFPGCYAFAVGRGDQTFVAASPELLVRREGMRASTLALAGSARRSADPSVDDHLGEQLLRSAKDREEHAIVVRRIAHTLDRIALWVTAAPEPVLAKVANIQHLATPIRAQLRGGHDVVSLLARLHPTPAVGGEPWEVAGPLIPALEGLDRGWYAGPVGWTDAAGDGEFCVALRCALLDAGLATCFAGVGVVRDSDPAAELEETEVKLAALLPVLAG